MSRAFVGEHESWGDPGYRISLPPRDDPGFDVAAAEAMLEAARAGQTGSAEMATGYYWGESGFFPRCRPSWSAPGPLATSGSSSCASATFRSEAS